jgi:hypothetical protein
MLYFFLFFADDRQFLVSDPLPRDFSAFTLGFWVKDTMGADAELFGYLDPRAPDTTTFVLNWYSQLLAIEFRDSVQLRLYNASVLVPSANEWFHIAVSWSATDRRLRMHQNFQEIVSEVLPVVCFSRFTRNGISAWTPPRRFTDFPASERP